MVKKPTRLRFSEDDLTDPKVRKAAERAGKATAKAEKAVAKLPVKKKSAKLRTETEASAARKAKLRFEKADTTELADHPSRGGHMASRSAAAMLSAKAHRAISEYAEDNVGVQTMQETTQGVEAAAHMADHAIYSHKLKAYDKADKLVKKSDKANVDALYEVFKKDNPDSSSNPLSRWRQKQAIKKEYAAAKAGGGTAKTTGAAAQSIGKSASETKSVLEKATNFVRSHSRILLIVLAGALLFMIISGMLSSCSAMFPGGAQVVLGTSFTAEDEDILGAEQDYTAMENALRQKINNIETTHPGYDEYKYNLSEIGHNPYELAAVLTVLYEDYTREEVQTFLRQLFNAQYGFSTSTSTKEVTETKTIQVGESLGTVTTSGYCSCVICCGIWSGGPTASGVYPTANHTIAVDASNPFVPMGTKVVMNGVEYTVEDTGNFARYGVQFDVYYDSHSAARNHGHRQWECYLADSNGSNSVEVTKTVTKQILTVTATNNSLGSVIANLGLTDDQMERYHLLLQTKGNKPDLFGDNIYVSTGEYTDYDIPGEALTDVRFANMIREAEKYLGYPYVWGGSSPSTSFDCSGFVSWVINNCGNGWSVGRRTANGLMDVCDIIPKSAAQPGDLIFFQGTYNTSGASHVGIYVGNGMMIHCGNPISYASTESSYWQQHFYCIGRIRD